MLTWDFTPSEVRVARITRKELKTDKFALEVEHTVDFFEEHRQEVMRYGAIALVVVLLAAGIYFYRSHQRGVREAALSQALQVLEAPIAPAPPGVRSFPTAQARDQEATKDLTQLAVQYSGTGQGTIAQYTLGAMAADAGRLGEAEKLFKEAADSGDKLYGSLAKMSLAQIYFSSNRVAQGEALLRSVMDHPTALVSKDEATIALARGIAKTKPIEARRLLDPLRSSRNSAVSQVSIQLYTEIPQ